MAGIPAAISHHEATLGIETIEDVRVPATMEPHSSFEIFIFLKVRNKLLLHLSHGCFFSVIYK